MLLIFVVKKWSLYGYRNILYYEQLYLPVGLFPAWITAYLAVVFS